MVKAKTARGDRWRDVVRMMETRCGFENEGGWIEACWARVEDFQIAHEALGTVTRVRFEKTQGQMLYEEFKAKC